MVAKFNTGGLPATSSGKSGNTLLYIVIGAVLVYGIYNYVIKPYLEADKKKEETPKQ
ncbi:MAG TPA: hypothetical protein PLN38_07440 [Chitinophagales bacterium]|nr:hypothetical protein [Chitinophagales bacterium]